MNHVENVVHNLNIIFKDSLTFNSEEKLIQHIKYNNIL